MITCQTSPVINERKVRELLAKKSSGTYCGLWFLIPEHLRLGSWDLLKHWSSKDDNAIEPRVALQMVHESALCVNGVRPVRSLCHQGFELLNGLPYIATDKAVHELLDAHTVSEAKMMQIALGKLRQASGHYVGEIFAVDPHRIRTYSQRMMPAKKSKPQSSARKILQTFFCLDAILGQPIAFTIGSSGRTASRAGLELLDMINAIIPQGGLAIADTEHVTVELMSRFYEDKCFDILMPMSNTKKVTKLFEQLDYERKWAGYALANTSYKLQGMKQPINLIVQRSGEVESEFKYKAFGSTCFHPDANMVKMVTEDYPERWTIEEFFNFEAAMGWNRASTMNLNIRYGKMSLALIAQAVTYQFRQKLPKPYKTWTAKHLADTIFYGIDGDLRIRDDTIIVTMYNVPEHLGLKKYYVHLPEKLEAEGIDPRIPWLYNFKIDFRFK